MSAHHVRHGKTGEVQRKNKESQGQWLLTADMICHKNDKTDNESQKPHSQMSSFHWIKDNPVETRETCFAKGPSTFQIILLGDAGVGKTTYLRSLRNGRYSPPSSSILDNLEARVQCQDRTVNVHFKDTAGLERYRSLTHSYYKQANGCLLFFNIHKVKSFNGLEMWLKEIRTYKERENVALVLVGLNHKASSLSSDRLGANTDTVTDEVPFHGSEGMGYTRDKVAFISDDEANHKSLIWDIPYKVVDLHDPTSVKAAAMLLVEKMLEELSSSQRTSCSDSSSIAVTQKVSDSFTSKCGCAVV